MDRLDLDYFNNKDEDIEILKLIKDYENLKYTRKKDDKNKENQIIIDGFLYEFEEKYFFDKKISMKIPKDFDEMQNSMKRLKYPSDLRPDIIQTDKNSEIDISFKMMNEDVRENEIYDLTTASKDMLKNLNPGNIFLSEGVKNINSKNIGFLEFKSTAMDGFLYNIMFFSSLERKILMGKICCPYEKLGTWKYLGFEMMESFKIHC
ncbi:MAG: hypothetical protein N4A54_01395 [Peptostreptococcaceae bacterium]|jgi:hypothetical protein|nr:hypothetical protein [Peptostreptococcaceae bacterium]